MEVALIEATMGHIHRRHTPSSEVAIGSYGRMQNRDMGRGSTGALTLQQGDNHQVWKRKK